MIVNCSGLCQKIARTHISPLIWYWQLANHSNCLYTKRQCLLKHWRTCHWSVCWKSRIQV